MEYHRGVNNDMELGMEKAKNNYQRNCCGANNWKQKSYE